MTPLLLVAVGAFVIGAGIVVVRSFGPAGRIGRIIAGTRPVPIAAALAMARSTDARYVRVDGRIDSDEEFEDDAHRPLVLRLSRLELDRGGRWEAIETTREAVPFVVGAGPAAIEVDRDALDEGLVVLPREATGRAADVADRMPAGTAPDLPVRYVIRQVSSVEHAAVLGVPVVGEDGKARMTAGLGRPLILTTLETDEALRLLGGGRRARSALAFCLLGIGALVLTAGAVWALVAAITGAAIAASPTPTPAAGDPRSPGEGPGLVGDPLVALIAVLIVGLATALVTLAWTRLRGGGRPV